MILRNKVLLKISGCWYNEFVGSLNRIKPYGVYTIKDYEEDKAPDYLVEYLLDKEFNKETHELLFDIIKREFQSGVSIEDISERRIEKQRITVEGKHCNIVNEILEEKKSVSEDGEDKALDGKTEKFLQESIAAYLLLLESYQNKRDNQRLTLKATQLLYKFALHNIHLCRFTGEEVSIRATYKGLQAFSILIEDYIGDNTTLFRDLKLAVALKFINIDKNSSKNAGTLWRLPNVSIVDVIGKLAKLNKESKKGVKVGNMCLSQTQMAFGKHVVSDSYIDETFGKRISKEEFKVVLKKVNALIDIQDIVAEKFIMDTLSHEEQLTFLSCRSKVCHALNIDRVKYSSLKKAITSNEKIHGNTMVYLRNK